MATRLKKATDAAAGETTAALRDGASHRKNRTVSLDDTNYRRLKSICSDEGKSVSEVIDSLIESFLKRYDDMGKRSDKGR